MVEKLWFRVSCQAGGGVGLYVDNFSGADEAEAIAKARLEFDGYFNFKVGRVWGREVPKTVVGYGDVRAELIGVVERVATADLAVGDVVMDGPFDVAVDRFETLPDGSVNVYGVWYGEGVPMFLGNDNTAAVAYEGNRNLIWDRVRRAEKQTVNQ